jgi:tRNA(Ile)-lysidine synthase
VEFDRARWLALTVPEQRALLRLAAQRLLPGERDVDFTPIDRAVRFSRTAAPGRSCDVLGGLRLKVTAEAVVVSPWDYRPVRGDLPLIVDGQLARPWRFAAEPLAPGAWSLAEVEANADPWCAWVDLDTLPLPAPEWRLRTRRPGDRFRPLGLDGHSVKLSDFLINARIDEALRDRWPLVACGDEIVWVAGLRPDERYKVTGETRRAVRLMFVRDKDDR